MSNDELMGCAYLRFTTKNDPAALGQLTGALGGESVGVASVVQREDGGDSVTIVVLTQTASEAALGRALAKIEALPVVMEAPRVIRIEEEV